MNRRLFAALSLLGLLLVAGCVDSGVLGGTVPNSDDGTPGNATKVPTPDEREPVVREVPAVPESRTTETVGQFIEEYEEVRMHNELVSEVEDIVRLGINCNVDSVATEEDVYTVTVDCGHWYEFDNSDGRGIADGAPYRIEYVVRADGSVEYGERKWVTGAGE